METTEAAFTAEDFFLLTGASGGIGAAILKKLVAEGASVVALGRNRAALEAARLETACADRVHIFSKDLRTDLESLRVFGESLVKTYGPFRGYVSAAGILRMGPVNMLRLEDLRALLDVNFLAAVELFLPFTKAAARRAEFSGVFISSLSAVRPSPINGAYAASKAALDIFVRTAAAELAPQGVRLNAVLPGVVKTPMAAVLQSVQERTGQTPPPFGYGEPTDVAELVLFLASQKSRWITGQTYIIDGGLSLNTKI